MGGTAVDYWTVKEVGVKTGKVKAFKGFLSKDIFGFIKEINCFGEFGYEVRVLVIKVKILIKKDSKEFTGSGWGFNGGVYLF